MDTTFVGILLTLAGCTLAAPTIQIATSQFDAKQSTRTNVLIIPNGQSYTINCGTAEKEFVVFLKSSKFANPIDADDCPVPAKTGWKPTSNNAQLTGSVKDCRTPKLPARDRLRCSITAEDVSTVDGCSNRPLIVVYTCEADKRLMVNNMIDDFD